MNSVYAVKLLGCAVLNRCIICKLLFKTIHKIISVKALKDTFFKVNAGITQNKLFVCRASLCKSILYLCLILSKNYFKNILA